MILMPTHEPDLAKTRILGKYKPMFEPRDFKEDFVQLVGSHEKILPRRLAEEVCELSPNTRFVFGSNEGDQIAVRFATQLKEASKVLDMRLVFVDKDYGTTFLRKFIANWNYGSLVYSLPSGEKVFFAASSMKFDSMRYDPMVGFLLVLMQAKMRNFGVTFLYESENSVSSFRAVNVHEVYEDHFVGVVAGKYRNFIYERMKDVHITNRPLYFDALYELTVTAAPVEYGSPKLKFEVFKTNGIIKSGNSKISSVEIPSCEACEDGVLG